MGKDWKHIEKLVHAIERSISPNARVEHDVHLPQVGSLSGAKSQCDIVIWEGSVARPLLTIVEVQSRKSKVNINNFLGWLKKRDLVGAHRLVCVSRTGFSSTIKEVAAREAGRVVLVMLHELSPSELPLDFVRFQLQYRHFKLCSLLSVRINVSRIHLDELGVRERFHDEKRKEAKFGEKLWSLDGVSLMSMEDLLRDRTESAGDFSGRSRVVLGGSGVPIYTYFDGLFIRCEIDIEFEYINRLYSVPMSTLGYEQIEHGVLGWVMAGDIKTEFGDIGVKIPIYRGEGGGFRMRDADVIFDGMECTPLEIYEADSAPPWYG